MTLRLTLADIDQLITITGMVIRTSNLIPEINEGLFRCSVCRQEVSVEVERGRIAEPTLCTHCNTNHSFAMIYNRSHFSDKQVIFNNHKTSHTVTGAIQLFVAFFRW